MASPSSISSAIPIANGATSSTSRSIWEAELQEFNSTSSGGSSVAATALAKA
jgi:hypothetical protein